MTTTTHTRNVGRNLLEVYTETATDTGVNRQAHGRISGRNGTWAAYDTRGQLLAEGLNSQQAVAAVMAQLPAAEVGKLPEQSATHPVLVAAIKAANDAALRHDTAGTVVTMAVARLDAAEAALQQARKNLAEAEAIERNLADEEHETGVRAGAASILYAAETIKLLDLADLGYARRDLTEALRQRDDELLREALAAIVAELNHRGARPL